MGNVYFDSGHLYTKAAAASCRTAPVEQFYTQQYFFWSLVSWILVVPWDRLGKFSSRGWHGDAGLVLKSSCILQLPQHSPFLFATANSWYKAPLLEAFLPRLWIYNAFVPRVSSSSISCGNKSIQSAKTFLRLLPIQCRWLGLEPWHHS